MSRVPALAKMPYAITLSGEVGGLHETKRVTMPTVEIGGYTFKNVPTDFGSVADGPYEGRANAGIQLFRPFQVTLDLGHDRLWLKPIGGVPVFTKDRAGMFSCWRATLNVLHVTPGQPGRAGWPQEGRQAGRDRRRAGRPGLLHVEAGGLGPGGDRDEGRDHQVRWPDRHSHPGRLFLMRKRWPLERAAAHDKVVGLSTRRATR